MRCPTLSELPPPPLGKTGWPWTEESPQLSEIMSDGRPWPQISIVTPSYNQEQFLKEAIRSVLLQGYPTLEYIVMDGGSTDSSVEIIKSYASYSTYWCSEKDKGQADAISRGFNLSNGEILGWLNSDDLLLPISLYKVARYFLEHPEIDCVVGGSIVIDGSGRVVRNRLGMPKIVMGGRETFKSLLLRGGLSFYQAASFWRREAYFAIGGLDSGLDFAMDYDFYLRLARIKPFGHLNQLLACFRLHPGSKTTLLQSVRQRECAELWKRHGRDSIGPVDRVFYQAYLVVSNIVQNLPVRIGAATGFVALPDVTGRRGYG